MIKKILIVMGILLIVVGFIGINQPKNYYVETIEPQVTIIYPGKQTSPSEVPLQEAEENTEVNIQPTEETENSSEPTKHNTLKKKTDKADFTLSVGGNSVRISKGIDEETLEKGPGWMPLSAAPGENGVCVIYGHRNRNHLRLLKDVKVGDDLIITCERKDYIYQIEEMQIFDKEEIITIPSADEPMLMIMTCYPFRYEGRAPRQIVIFGKITG